MILLALMLAWIAIVPLTSAENDDDITENEEPGSTGIITPVFDDSVIVLKEPVNESEMISFIFPEDRVLQLQGSSESVVITIPKSGLREWEIIGTSGIMYYSDQEIAQNERVALLQLPRDELDQNNPPDSDSITLDYPLTYYSFFPGMAELAEDAEKRKSYRIADQELRVVRNIRTRNLQSEPTDSMSDYKEWDTWKRNSTRYRPVALRGDMKPDEFTHPGQRTRNYHETEILLNRPDNNVELLLWYCDDGRIWLSAPIYDESDLIWTTGDGGTGMRWIDVSAMNRINYEFYVNSNGHYIIRFYNTGEHKWYDFDYDDSDDPASYINRIALSTELSTEPVPPGFETITNIMKAYQIKDRDNPDWNGTCQRFSHESPPNNNRYVLLNANRVGDAIYSYHRAATDQT